MIKSFQEHNCIYIAQLECIQYACLYSSRKMLSYRLTIYAWFAYTSLYKSVHQMKKFSINYNFRYFTFNQLHRCNITVLAAKWTEFLMTNWTKPTTYTTELTNSGKTYLLLLMPVHRAVLPHPTAEATHAFLEEAAFPVWWSYTIRFSQVCWYMEDYTKRKKKKINKINSYFGESTDSVSW